ncbi:PH domain-containing protein [Saccharomonospora sp.]|uniref:PH domain-containing protein n=1 Tax=Saccharomonospora sp. TaxID=33913 RepID=UPI0026243A30|nr:PH domain-containing protein [Saccharomonospora sp.]
MDNSARAWAPKPGLVGVGWVLTAVAAGALGWSATSGDRPGTLLLAVVTAAFLAASLHGTVVRPRLSADGDGLRVRTLGGTRSHPWSRVDLRLTTTRRYGRDAQVIELDAVDGQLTVFGWVELGTDPHEVHEELLRLRQTPHSAG